jgi:hypothetical protein
MTKREPVDPATGITPGAMRTMLKAALRPIWRRTSRKVFIQANRYRATNPKTGRQWFVLDCANCGRVMGVGEKERRPLKSGGLSKKARSVFEIHHTDGISPLKNIRQTLGEYYQGLIFGQMECLCYKCHKKYHNKSEIKNNGE